MRTHVASSSMWARYTETLDHPERLAVIPTMPVPIGHGVIGRRWACGAAYVRLESGQLLTVPIGRESAISRRHPSARVFYGR